MDRRPQRTVPERGNGSGKKEDYVFYMLAYPPMSLSINQVSPRKLEQGSRKL